MIKKEDEQVQQVNTTSTESEAPLPEAAAVTDSAVTDSPKPIKKQSQSQEQRIQQQVYGDDQQIDPFRLFFNMQTQNKHEELNQQVEQENNRHFNRKNRN